jgi:hypothetical protein
MVVKKWPEARNDAICSSSRSGRPSSAIGHWASAIRHPPCRPIGVDMTMLSFHDSRPSAVAAPADVDSALMAVRFKIQGAPAR